ncbi:P-loop containing nucleoside triphosphate hydrolase protein [Aspergillus cavernicola]|uniref:P-loop containing nucleoside triphosphate hydrolase protein n=1 Tax=Aspergillus cavernicola TaxID=176166 RepID=A0ABR4I9H6_9EURO
MYHVPLDLTNIPAIKQFIGREGDLDHLRGSLFPMTSSDQKIVVLHGLAGIGKTQLAIHFAISCKDAFSAVFWLNAATRETLCQSLAMLLPRLGHNENEPTAKQDLEQQARSVLKWLSKEGNSKWLLIYDNADQCSAAPTEQIFATSYNIAEFIPPANQGSIIITTRDMKLSKSVRLSQLYSVQRLPTEQAVQLLMSYGVPALRAGHQSTTRLVDKGPLTLADRLDGLPLALAVAGAYIQETGTPPGKYLEMYSDSRSWADLFENTEANCQYPNGDLIRTFRLSYSEVKRKSYPAAQLLLLLSCFDNRDVWYDLICNGINKVSRPTWLAEITTSEARFRRTIGELRNFCLVERTPPDNDSFSMHPVVQDWCRHQIKLEEEKVADQQGENELLTTTALRAILKAFRLRPTVRDGNYISAFSHIQSESSEQ